MSSSLPDLFRFANGTRVVSAEGWPRRRAELMAQVLDLEYGALPPAPTSMRAELLHRHGPVRHLGDAFHAQYRLVCEGGRGPVSFIVDLLSPKSAPSAEDRATFPVAVNGDGCWRYVSEEIEREVLARGFILATFNRTELACDNGSSARDHGLYLAWPDGAFGALSAWAWGYHRVVDFLFTLPQVDPGRIALVGHSRGGKCVLLAGATDVRVAVTAPNDSGCGGAGSFRIRGEKCERIADLCRHIPYWFSGKFRAFVDREEELPFDQHAVKALIAPRAYLSTEAHGDLWANPAGTWQTHRAAAEAWKLLGAADKIGIWYRQGPHFHGLDDWKAFLDFCERQFSGKNVPTRFDGNPFPELAPAHDWGL